MDVDNCLKFQLVITNRALLGPYHVNFIDVLVFILITRAEAPIGRALGNPTQIF